MGFEETPFQGKGTIMRMLRLTATFSADHSESDYQYVTWGPREDVSGQGVLKDALKRLQSSARHRPAALLAPGQAHLQHQIKRRGDPAYQGVDDALLPVKLAQTIELLMGTGERLVLRGQRADGGIRKQA